MDIWSRTFAEKSNNEYIKTKTSLYKINFHGNKRPKRGEYYKYSVLLVKSIIDIIDNYHPQIFIEKNFVCNNPIKQIVQINDESDDHKGKCKYRL